MSDRRGTGPGPWRVHGGLTADARRRMEIGDGPIIDFSVNVNPYGPTPAMRAAIREAPVASYPDDGARAAREALARLWRVSPDEIVLGHGAADLLWLLARLLLPAGGQALIVEPTFSEFGAAVHSLGAASVHAWRADAADDFRVDPDAVLRALGRRRADAVYLCAPNNPTGAHVGAADVARLADRNPGTTFVIDQAFLSLSEHFADAEAPRPPNVVWVRSLTKDHAIPGLRVGAAVMPPSLATRLEAARPSWSTSAAAQAAAVAAAAAQAQDFVADSRRRLLDERRALERALAGLGCTTVPSSTIFLLAIVGDAASLTDRLLRRHRILVRDCTSFGLPGHVRLAARPASDRAALIDALRAERA
ncbi:MAG TPA: histidinol-phosphate transaminase [Polyangia bacterium]|nr:histidinol-phosphate transaminase [Polyangia bacterium]